MKKKKVVTIILFCSILLCSCGATSGITRTEYDELQSQNETLQSKNEELENKNKELQDSLKDTLSMIEDQSFSADYIVLSSWAETAFKGKKYYSELGTKDAYSNEESKIFQVVVNNGYSYADGGAIKDEVMASAQLLGTINSILKNTDYVFIKYNTSDMEEILEFCISLNEDNKLKSVTLNMLHVPEISNGL